MRLVLELGVADLAATRFAVSPLAETLRALPLLANPGRSALNRPWVRWARAELDQQPLRLPRVWPLIVNDLPYWPEFLFPAPAGKSPGFDEELACLCATPAEAVRASLRRVFGEGRWPDTATDLFERPREALAEIAAEIAEYHDRLIAPHWERIRPVLDADISYHAALLAGGGARSLFSDLHPDLRWSAGRLFMTDAEAERADPWVGLGPDGLVLCRACSPGRTGRSRRRRAPRPRCCTRRGARRRCGRAGCPASAGSADRAAVESLLGAPRARLLDALRSPRRPARWPVVSV